MPVRRLPPNPSLDHLKYQAKDMLCLVRGKFGPASSAPMLEAAQRIREFHPRFASASDADICNAKFTLSDAQLTIARVHGFASWARLKRHIEQPTLADQLHLPHHERIEDAVFQHAVGLIDAGDAAGLRVWLRQHPKLVHQHVLFEGGNYFRSPSLLEFVAENPVRHGKMPANIVDVAREILAAGADIAARNETLLLVATGRVARECKMQVPLLDLLCDGGADASNALHAAAAHNQQEAVLALIRRGVIVDLPVAAALGRSAECAHLLSAANPAERHLALALAAQFGYVEIVRTLLDAGEDPNRYNPLGCHSHATPLHQAVAAGQEAVVHLLVERGARLDWKDALWGGTPADWAAHQGRPELEAYLRACSEAGSRLRSGGK